MIAKTERELILTKPSAYTSWSAKQVTYLFKANLNFPPKAFCNNQEEIRVEYFFGGASAHKWQHPCVASISCEINTADQEQFESTKVQP